MKRIVFLLVIVAVLSAAHFVTIDGLSKKIEKAKSCSTDNECIVFYDSPTSCAEFINKSSAADLEKEISNNDYRYNFWYSRAIGFFGKCAASDFKTFCQNNICTGKGTG